MDEVIKIRRPTERVIDIRCATHEQADKLAEVLQGLSGMHFERTRSPVLAHEQWPNNG